MGIHVLQVEAGCRWKCTCICADWSSFFRESLHAALEPESPYGEDSFELVWVIHMGLAGSGDCANKSKWGIRILTNHVSATELERIGRRDGTQEKAERKTEDGWGKRAERRMETIKEEMICSRGSKRLDLALESQGTAADSRDQEEKAARGAQNWGLGDQREGGDAEQEERKMAVEGQWKGREISKHCRPGIDWVLCLVSVDSLVGWTQPYGWPSMRETFHNDNSAWAWAACKS